jgi:formylglycine-generating enzyme required for sulfatase activity
VTVTITGSTGLDADVTVTGPGSYSEHLTATRTLTGLARGTYTITAKTVVEGTVNRYPLKLTQTVAVNGADTATVYYPAATLTVSIPATPPVPMTFVLVPAGSFTMGDNGPNEGGLGSLPTHPVTIGQAFYVAETELTQAQWTAVMGTNPSSFPGNNHPVEGVSWNDIQTPSTGFLAKLNTALSGHGFRLPTEAEWEYVCRAGTSKDFFFGDTNIEANLGTYAVWKTSSTAEVKTKSPNPWGLYDILGNVWEWTGDDSHPDYTGAPVDGSAWVYSPRSGSCIRRGGCFRISLSDYFRSAFRSFTNSAQPLDTLGFRLVMPAP